MMVQVIDVESVVPKNSKVESEKLRDAQKAMDALRKIGVEPKTYNLLIPFDRSHLRVLRRRESVTLPTSTPTQD